MMCVLGVKTCLSLQKTIFLANLEKRAVPQFLKLNTKTQAKYKLFQTHKSILMFFKYLNKSS